MPVAIVGTIVNEHSTINGKAYSSENPVIPKGFMAINVEIPNHESSWTAKDGPQVKEGLVISDGNSEFVWIPVSDIGSFVRLKKGSQTDYQTILYGFKGITASEREEDINSYREPDYIYNYDKDYLTEFAVLESLDNDNDIDLNDLKILLQNNFNNMVASVAKYGGFYIGRYETSLNGNVAQSKYGEPPMNNLNWYELYKNSLTYSNSNINLGVTSEMVWGCQWYAMLRFILNGKEASHVTAKTNVSHDLSLVYLTGGKDYSGSVKYNDIASNIYDLEGNVNEATQEASGNTYRIYHGGSMCWDNQISIISNTPPVNSGPYHGSRLSLYVD